MKYRLQAFGLHLLSSALVLTLVLGAIYLAWYRWPGWYLAGASHVTAIILAVDLVLGPTLTFVVASSSKPRRVLARDLAVIVTVQLAGLAYGASTLWQGRPLYYAFSVNCMQMVQASDLDAREIMLAEQQAPALAPRWYSRPRWVWAPLPKDQTEAAKIVNGAVLGGADVVNMPRFYRPWADGLPALRPELATVDSLWGLSKRERPALKSRMHELGLATDVANTLLLWGPRRAVVVFDPTNLEVKAVLRPG